MYTMVLSEADLQIIGQGLRKLPIEVGLDVLVRVEREYLRQRDAQAGPTCETLKSQVNDPEFEAEMGPQTPPAFVLD
jgi:hypothetical protein